MKKINYWYFGLPEKMVEDKEDFYKSGIPEATKIRNIITTAQRLFVTSSRNIILSIIEGGCYKINVYRSGTEKSLISTLYYIPKEYRLDIYDGGNLETPLFVWSQKQCVTRNIGVVLGALKVETLLMPLVAYI
jgi:hypothetical protein